MKHYMVDLETLGSTPGCAILSIGAVRFYPERGELGEEFYTNVSLQSCLEAGLTIEEETFHWWLKQSENARIALTATRPSTLFSALICLENYLDRDALMWSHGSSFDLAVLSSAYKAVNMKKPWEFRNERDTRTFLDIAGHKMTKIENAHHALEDAKNQALCIMRAMNALRDFHL